MRLMGTAPSISKSPASLPNGSRDGRSRLVQMVRTVSASTSGSTGRPERSTSERKTSVPSSSRWPEGRRVACQKVLILARFCAVAEGIKRLELDDLVATADWR